MTISLSLFIEALASVLCLHYLYGKKFAVNRITCGFFAIEVLWMLMIYYLHFDQRWSLLIYFILFVYCAYNFGFNIKRILVNVILYVIITGTVQATIMVIYTNILHVQEILELESLIINFIYLIIVVVVLKKCRLQRLSDIFCRKEILLVLAAVVAVMMLVFCLLIYRKSEGFDVFYYTMFLMCVILIAIVIVDIGKHKMQVIETKAELKLHKVYEESFQKLVEDICARQHEFDNHINAIYSQHFLYKSYDELVNAQKKYCTEIVKENSHNKLLSKGNPTIISFLYGKILEAEKRGCAVKYKVTIGDLECKVPIHKMVEILGNLIDNATEDLEKNSNRAMFISIIEKEQDILIEIGNETKTIVYEEIQTLFVKGYSKKGKNRGYGLYNVKNICDNYKIELSCENRELEEKNWIFFVLHIKK